MSDLLATKFHRPSIPAKWVRRTHLIQRLNEGLDSRRKVTLVSAPAGFGKSSCIAEWVSALDSWPVSWLSLDSADDDPVHFITYFIAALQKVDAKLGQEIEGVIRSGQLPAGEIVCTVLINDILTLDERFLLVLDDFHVIQERYVLQFMQQLVASFPDPLHLVLITREDPPLPLARLRANNQMTEIRAMDLRFTRREMDRFLNEVMSLSLSEADIAALEDKTEGWIAGLQLAAIAMHSSPSHRDRASPSTFIATLSGSHRFILDYLTEQVLNQQPEDIRDFLLETSILEKLNGDLCDAVSRRSNSYSLLEQLYNANLFLIPLDDERQWYRYHHLFAGLLRDLQNAFLRENKIELHRRASRWYAQAGMANEAIEHALTANDFATAVDLLERHALEMIMQGYANTVDHWVRSLPEEWGRKSLRTNLAFAWALMLRGAYSQASDYLGQLRATIGSAHKGEADSSIRAEWLVMQSLILYMQGKTAECLAMAAEALELTPAQDSRMRSLAYYVQASVHQLMEDYPRAIAIYQKSIQHSRAAENLVAEMMSTGGLAGMLFERGQVRLAFETASQAIERLERSAVRHPISAVVYASLGDAHYQWYQIDAARQNFNRALHLSILGGSNTITIFCHVLLSRLAQIEGDLDTAAGEIQKAVGLLPVEAPEYVRQGVVSQQVRIYLALNRPAAAEMALQGLGIIFSDQLLNFDSQAGRTAQAFRRENISSSIGLVYNSSLRLLLYRARAGKDPTTMKSGIELADRIIGKAFESEQIMVALETLLLRAQMYVVLGKHAAGLADYVKVLELAEPEGLIGVFVEAGQPAAEHLAALVEENQLVLVQQGYAERILDAFSKSGLSHTHQPVTDLPAGDGLRGFVEPLTDRELDVLRLMAKGFKYKEIADQLFISLNTVRYHVKAIYGKLNVSNRTQAIELARRLQVL